MRIETDPCGECGGFEYDKTDDGFCCRVCQTVNTDLREFETEYRAHDDANASRGTTLLIAPMQSSQSAKEKVARQNFMRPWLSIEGNEAVF